MHIDLKGKNILVTGASRGIGRAIAVQLAKSGASVAIHCNQNLQETIELSKELGGGCRAYQADLANSEAVIQLFEGVTAEMKSLDVLINNAGIALSAPISEPEDEWLASWERTLTVNLTASAILSRKMVQHLLKCNTGGRIINISSRAAFRGDTPDYLAYASSKSGLIALTKTIARGYGKQGIKAFAIAPGFVKTDMAHDFISQYGESHASGDIALERLTTPEDLAPLIAFLSSGLADHATGSTIDINAGSYMH